MTDSPASDETPRARMYQFGAWTAQNDNAEPPTELGQRMIDWFQRKPVELDQKLSEALWIEFSAIETFRTRLMQAIARCANEIKGAAGKSTDGLDVPHPRTLEYRAGYLAGQYRAHSEDASLVASVINGEVAQLARESEQLRAERLARLGTEGDGADQSAG